MDIRFSPFRRKPSGLSHDVYDVPSEPVPRDAVPRSTDKPKRLRKVTIVHPEQGEAYRLKARLLSDGHGHVETFFLPESFLTVYRNGHRPDIVIIHDFMAEEAGMTGVQLARLLRLQDKYRGLVYSSSPDHAGIQADALLLHGFSGRLQDYFDQ